MTELDKQLEKDRKSDRRIGRLLLVILIFFGYLQVWSWTMPSPTEAFKDAYTICLWGPKGKEGEVPRTPKMNGMSRHYLELSCMEVATRAQKNAMPPPFNWLIW